MTIANHVAQDHSIDKEIKKLWSLESLGITESNEVHEEFVDNVSFNGGRYSVKFPWKENCGDLPSNFVTSMMRLKVSSRNCAKNPSS